MKKRDNAASKKEASLFRTAFGLSVSLFPNVLPPLFLTLCLWAMGLAITFVWRWALIFLFPFLFLPSFFALLLSINDINAGGSVSFSRFFGYFLLAYTRDVRSSFRLLRSFFSSLLFALMFGLLFSFLYYEIGSFLSPSFSEAARAFLAFLTERDYQEAQSLLLSEEGLLSFRLIVSFAFEGSFLLSFFCLFLRNSIIPLILRGTPLFRSSFRIAVFTRTISEKSNGFKREFQTALAPLYVFLPLCLLLGFALPALMLREEAFLSGPLLFSISLSSLAFGLLLLSPYYHEVLLSLASHYDLLFTETSLKLSEEALSSIMAVHNESIAQMEIAKKNVEYLRQKVAKKDENVKKEDGENPEK